MTLTHADNYPPGWREFHRHLKKGGKGRDFRFRGRDGDVVRFGNRYRMAMSFRAVTLDDYSPNTTVGYSSLFRLFLVWSAFEQFALITGFVNSKGFLKHKKIDKLFEGYNARAVLRHISTCDRNKEFCRFLYDEARSPALKRRLKGLLGGKPVAIGAVCSGVRNAFAHGALTPHVRKKKPETVHRISESLSEFIMNVMKSEFSRMIKDGIETKAI